MSKQIIQSDVIKNLPDLVECVIVNCIGNAELREFDRTFAEWVRSNEDAYSAAVRRRSELEIVYGHKIGQFDRIQVQVCTRPDEDGRYSIINRYYL